MAPITCMPATAMRVPAVHAQLRTVPPRPDPVQSALGRIALGAASVCAAAHIALFAQPALAGKTFLDLPECDTFQQAGAIAYCGTCVFQLCVLHKVHSMLHGVCHVLRDTFYCVHTDVKVGNGPPPEAGDLIVVDYTAREMVNNTVYDGSRGFALTIGNGEVLALVIHIPTPIDRSTPTDYLRVGRSNPGHRPGASSQAWGRAHSAGAAGASVWAAGQRVLSH